MDRDAARLENVEARLLELPRKSWEQGVALQALLELGHWSKLGEVVEQVVARQTEDGRLGVAEHDASATDPAACGEAVLRWAERSGQPRLHEAARRMLAYLETRAPRDEHGVLHHLIDAPEIWIDSAYMAPPFLAVCGRFEDALRQIEGYRRRLWNPERRLFAHQWDDARRTLKRAACWGVGNGWAAAGFARVLLALPEARSVERARLAGQLRELIDGCLAQRRPDGLFHDVIDDPSTFVETNLAQMLAYAIYRLLAHGWLDRSYLAEAERMRSAVLAKVDARGWVQGVCAAPAFDRPGTAAEGQAFQLLMEAARRDLAAA